MKIRLAAFKPPGEAAPSPQKAEHLRAAAGGLRWVHGELKLLVNFSLEQLCRSAAEPCRAGNSLGGIVGRAEASEALALVPNPATTGLERKPC